MKSRMVYWCPRAVDSDNMSVMTFITNIVYLQFSVWRWGLFQYIMFVGAYKWYFYIFLMDHFT